MDATSSSVAQAAVPSRPSAPIHAALTRGRSTARRHTLSGARRPAVRVSPFDPPGTSPTGLRNGGRCDRGRPPFRVAGLTPTPIYMPEQRVNGDWILKIVFPMGAVRRGADWVVSAGLNDSDVRLLRFSHDDLVQHMEF